jgi:TonB family protein
MDTFSDSSHRYSAIIVSAGFHSILFLLFLHVLFESPGKQERPVVAAGLPGFELIMDVNGTINPEDHITEPPADKAEKFIRQDSEEPLVIKEKIAEAADQSEFSAALQKLKKFRNNGGPASVITGMDPRKPGTEPIVSIFGEGARLPGRSLLNKPERLTDSEAEGIVVVSIIVDENGNVTEAVPGQRGSTTQDAALYKKAKEAAFHAKFNPSPEGIKEQKGTYTFVFTLE